MDPQTTALLQALRNRLGGLYGDNLRAVILYGSRARGDADPDSDVDVLIVLGEFENEDDEAQRLDDTAAKLSLQFDLVLACRVVRESDFEFVHTPLLLNIRREGVAV